MTFLNKISVKIQKWECIRKGITSFSILICAASKTLFATVKSALSAANEKWEASYSLQWEINPYIDKTE